MKLLLAKRLPVHDDSGNAIIEFVFVAILVLVPLVYLIATIAVLQRAKLATTDAARDVGRAIATSDSREQAPARAAAALRIAVSNQGLSPADVQLRYVAAGDDCQQGQPVTPSLDAGAQFQVCVICHQRLPAVPTVLSGRGVVTIGRYLVHIDDFRTVAP